MSDTLSEHAIIRAFLTWLDKERVHLAMTLSDQTCKRYGRVFRESGVDDLVPLMESDEQLIARFITGAQYVATPDNLDTFGVFGMNGEFWYKLSAADKAHGPFLSRSTAAQAMQADVGYQRAFPYAGKDTE